MKKGKNSNKLILWLGIFIFTLGTIINYFQSSTITDNGYNLQNPLLLKLSELPPLFLVTFVIIIIPIVEEFIFRSWTSNKHFPLLFSTISISLFIYFTTFNTILSLTTLFLLILSFFIIKNIVFSAVLTSIIFALMHYGNTNYPITLLPLFGLSLIFSFIGLRYRIRWSMLAHITYNLIAVVPYITSFDSNSKQIEFENNSYRAQLKEVSIFSFEDDKRFISPDSISIISTLTQMVPKLSSFDNDLILSSKISSMKKFKLTVTSNPKSHINKEKLIEDLIKNTNVNSDTNNLEAYTIRIINNKFDPGKNHKNYMVTLYGFIDYLKTVKGLPVRLSTESLINKKISVSREFLFEKDHNTLIELIHNDPNFSISSKKEETISKIVFY